MTDETKSVLTIQPKDVPETPETQSCEKHGDYQYKYSEPLFGNVWVFRNCPTCSDERAEAERKREKAEKNEKNRKREEDYITDRLESAGVSKRLFNLSFDDYTTETPQKLKARRTCEELSRLICDGDRGFSLIMSGSVGTGKTGLSTEMVKQVVKSGKRARIISVIDMIRAFKATWKKDNNHTEEEVLDYYSSVDLLVIDEIGMQFGSDTEKLYFFDVINGRYEEMLPTVLISNLGIDGIKGVVGERIIDRLREDGGKLLAFDWESHRA